MSIKVEVWGDYGCFSRPELKVERCSYDVMTPSAARGLLEAIFWHPGLRWHIDRIHLLKPIAFTNIRRNEVKTTASARNIAAIMSSGKGEDFICTAQDIQQRAAMILQDVRYVIEAHFEMTDKAAPGDNPGKFQDIIKRRLQKGICYHQPYFGCREFPAHFQEWQGGDIPAIPETRDLGLMLYDMDYDHPGGPTPMFFRAALERGVLELHNCEVYR